MANTNVSLVDLDFETIKSNLKTYLKNADSPFKDVDFEGSNITHMLDVLAYNTYLNNFYLNMVASEMFLDTAQLRDSVVSHAKELNYVPGSFTSASAQISFTITPSTPLGALVVPKGTSFTTKLGSNNYSFTTNENLILSSNTDNKFYANLTIYEGSYVSDSYVFNTANTSQRFVISNPTVDIKSISVVVLEDGGSNVHTYSLATSYLGLNSTSKAFFLQAAENSQYEILFGDNVIGRQPKSGSTILIEYRVCNGELPNGARIFDIDGPIQGQANVSTITTISAATGGTINESLEKIKINATRHYQNQERAVTTSDYETLLTTNFAEIQAVSAYGGENVSPPQYGRVFIAVDTFNADGASDQLKQKLYNFIKPRCSVSLEPVFVDPDFMYIDVQCNVKYNVNITTLKPSDISTLVTSAISQFNKDNLGKFKSTLYTSKLTQAINGCHNSIVANYTHIIPFKLVTPIIGKPLTQTYNFGFPLTQYFYVSYDDNIKSKVKAVYSTKFTYNNIECTLQDDNNGKIGIYSTDVDGNTVLQKYVGVVDYTTGIINITGLVVDNYVQSTGGHIHLYVNPLDTDIDSNNNLIIEIKDRDIVVNVTAVKA